MFNRKLLCSTGTMVSKYNEYNYTRAILEIEKLLSKEIIDGMELMMLTFYYDKYSDIITKIKEAGIPVPVIHCEKEIGSKLSDAGTAVLKGDAALADKLYKETIRLFHINCKIGNQISASKMVLHLWGGLNSDSNIDYNIEKLETLYKISSDFGIKLLIENVPCTTYDPLSNFHKILKTFDKAAFIFDTRFAMFHRQINQTLNDNFIYHHIEHVHISDIICKKKEFSSLKYILHPGTGSINFQEIAKILNTENYNGTITFESPVMNGNSLDINLLEKSLIYIGELMK